MLILVQIKENIKAPRHWPLWGEFTATRWIPRTKGPHKGPVTQKMFPFNDIIMKTVVQAMEIDRKASRAHWGVNFASVQKIDVLGVCIDGKLNFNEHVRRICSKASAQISALQRLTGLADCPGRKPYIQVL